jgi:hypothetical protein
MVFTIVGCFCEEDKNKLSAFFYEITYYSTVYNFENPSRNLLKELVLAFLYSSRL